MNPDCPPPLPPQSSALPISLAVKQLRKTYGDREVVAGLDFEVAAGSCFALLGPNGAGKTTTLRLCLGHAAPDSGGILLGGLPVPAAAQAARRKVGVVPQFDNLDPDFTVAENLLVYGRYFGLPDAAIRARIPELLEFASLTGKTESRIATLSGGMKRRLTLARALVNDPDIVFLDEPTTGLDPQARHLIWDRLKQLKNRGKTLILTTHFMDEAERLADHLLVMDHGRAITQGSPLSLIATHIEPRVVEVYEGRSGGPGPEALAEGATRLASRLEISGETAFFYCREAQVPGLLTWLETFPDLRILHRAANLEDVFLKLTGRDLRD